MQAHSWAKMIEKRPDGITVFGRVAALCSGLVPDSPRFSLHERSSPV